MTLNSKFGRQDIPDSRMLGILCDEQGCVIRIRLWNDQLLMISCVAPCFLETIVLGDVASIERIAYSNEGAIALLGFPPKSNLLEIPSTHAMLAVRDAEDSVGLVVIARNINVLREES